MQIIRKELINVVFAQELTICLLMHANEA